MSRLRILEKARRRPKTIPGYVRERILRVIAERLGARGEVELVVVFGGFLESEVFRDIDIALYTSHMVDIDEAPAYVDTVRDELEKVTGMGVDILLLEYTPPHLINHLLSRGRVIVEKKTGISSILRIHAVEEMRRLRKLNVYSQGSADRVYIDSSHFDLTSPFKRVFKGYWELGEVGEHGRRNS
jgi:predicted nucleotidyltransferase